MSSDRNSSKTPKPVLTSARMVRSPLTPRIAGANSTSTTPSARLAAIPRQPATTRTPVVSPRVKPRDVAPPTETPGNLNVTPRSTTRRARVAVSPSIEGLPVDIKPSSSQGEAMSGRNSAASGLSVGGGVLLHSTSRSPRPKSISSDNNSKSLPTVRSPGLLDLGQSARNDNIDNRFFHASDVPKQEPSSKKPEAKKTPSFFYADGREDRPPSSPNESLSSPVFAAISENRSSGPSIRAGIETAKSPPMLSPALVTAANVSPYFASAISTQQGPVRSPSPSKENIHLSYRKGASQIFGMRPAPTPISYSAQAPGAAPTSSEESRRPSIRPSHHKSPSLSSLDSAMSSHSRRRSATALDPAVPSSPLTNEIQAASIPLLAGQPVDLPLIDTSLASPALVASPSTFSPTKHASELAADARRERKVLDLEISNSSLLAINASLERELRRQKAELKRFRRLSRAGRFSINSIDLAGRVPEQLDTLDEDEREQDSDLFSMLDNQDGSSESEENDSILSGAEPLSPGAQATKEQDLLAKDEKRLRVDLERHKELLIQSQSMNQSIKRCMYATEEMIREGKKALEYHVSVSDVKLGGRILTGHEDDEIEVDDSLTDVGDGGMEAATGLMDLWSGISRRMEGSEGSGDRDSGVEVDKPLGPVSAGPQSSTALKSLQDLGRPPDETVSNIPLPLHGIDTGAEARLQRAFIPDAVS